MTVEEFLAEVSDEQLFDITREVTRLFESGASTSTLYQGFSLWEMAGAIALEALHRFRARYPDGFSTEHSVNRK